MVGLILGRRSGTSSLARDLWYRGFPLREPLDVRPMKSQPLAHFECWEARHINREIMHHFRMGSSVPGIPPFLKYVPLMEWLGAVEQPYIIKEPNICLTWPVWYRSAEAAGINLVAVWCRREPEEQAISLQKWYGMDAETSKWCVEMYEMSLTAAADKIETLEVHLLQNQDDRVNEAAKFFKRNGIKPGKPRDCDPVDAREGGDGDGDGKEGGGQESDGGRTQGQGAGDGPDAVVGSGEPAVAGEGSGDRVEA
uniref:Uncharacterized protein n=1 Tax=viral metagenome TaxID=1070528 RepID=A0A6M3KM94_9ZZZZ